MFIMFKTKFFKKTKLFFISPWLLAASITILILIIGAFAINSFQRNEQLLTESLFSKGKTIIRFVGAGMRTSTMMSPMGAGQIQQLIEQMSQEQEIIHIIVINKENVIMAHSDPAMLGELISRDSGFLRSSVATCRWHIISSATDSQKIFEVIRPFKPFHHGRGRGMGRLRQMMQQEQETTAGVKVDSASLPAGDWVRSLFKDGAHHHGQPTGHLILVGLNMTDMDNVIRQHQYNIIIMSMVLLLVGLGGWIFLLAAQSYKASQVALNNIQAFTAMLISRLPVGIIATNPQGRIKTFNQAAAVMTGLAVSETLNRMLAKELPSLLADLLINRDSSVEIINREILFPASAGESLVLHVSSVPIFDQNNIAAGRVLLMHDLTRLKNLEKKIERQNRLAVLGKMAAGVAHEIRNPLSSIKGFATLLGSKFSKQSKEQETAFLLISEVERLNRTISELLNYARPLPLKPKPLDLNELISSSLKLVTTDAENIGIEISYNIAPATPKIFADPDRLNQVLLNLYLNALEAMQRGGRLTVSGHSGERVGMVDIEVTDDGIGIPQESLARVVDPYFTTKPAGTGLGLAMVNKIIDEHGGNIRFASKVNDGTTVIISLPAA